MIGVNKNQISLASGKFSANCNQPITSTRYRVSGGTLVSLIFTPGIAFSTEENISKRFNLLIYPKDFP